MFSIANKTNFETSRHLSIAVTVVFAFSALAAFALSFPINLPIGPTHWDLFIYYDAIGRMNFGQLPSVDFMTPAGPLEYGLAWFLHHLFPTANPVLLTQLQWLPITAPVLLLILRDAQRFGPIVIWGLVLPWILMTALPFNPGIDKYPGVDAYGIYNRHGAHLMFLTLATVLFVSSEKLQSILLSVLLLSLAFCKITAFAAVGPLLLLGLLSRRIAVSTALVTASICITAVVAVELVTGMVSAYLHDIHELLSVNSGGFADRLLRAAESNLEVLVGGSALCAVLAYLDYSKHSLNSDRRQLSVLDKDWIWIGVSLFCGLAYETQNTGSHPYAVLWPALLLLASKPVRYREPFGKCILILGIVMVAPMTADVLKRAASTIVRFAMYQAINKPSLGVLGHVSAKPDLMRRAVNMRSVYMEHRPVMTTIAKKGEMPSLRFFAKPDFHLLYLLELAVVAKKIQALEANARKKFKSVWMVDFTSPAAYVLQRNAPRHVMIGAAPGRSVPPLSPETVDAISNVDLILEPKCPAEAQQKRLFTHYHPALKDRKRVSVTPCYDGLIKPDSLWATHFK
ncbi:MAG: hypothetical protein ABJQ71_09745 [Roseibium sp.]